MASSSNPKAIRSPSPTGSVRSTNYTPSTGTTTVFDNNKAKDDLRVDAFRGDRAKVGMFIAQLSAVFTLKQGAYPRNADKVLYAALHMKDSAFHWIEPLMMDHLTSPEDQKSQETKDVFSSFGISSPASSRSSGCQVRNWLLRNGSINSNKRDPRHSTSHCSNDSSPR